MTIREELLEATGVKPKKREIDAELIKRLISEGEDLDEEGWESLSTEAQEFYNSVIEAGKKHADGKVLELADVDVPPFPDEDDGVVDDGEDERGEEATDDDKDDEGEEVMETKAKKAATGKKTAAKKTAEPATKKTAASKKNGSGEKSVSAKSILKKLIIKNPALKVDDLETRLNKDGHKLSRMTIATTRSETRDTMKILVAQGLLDMEL
jgi:hypothetical protein